MWIKSIYNKFCVYIYFCLDGHVLLLTLVYVQHVTGLDLLTRENDDLEYRPPNERVVIVFFVRKSMKPRPVKDHERPLLRANEVADLLQLNVQSVYRLARQGRLPSPIVIGRRRYRWPPDQIDKLMRVPQGV